MTDTALRVRRLVYDIGEQLGVEHKTITASLGEFPQVRQIPQRLSPTISERWLAEQRGGGVRTASLAPVQPHAFALSPRAAPAQLAVARRPGTRERQ